MQLSSRRLYWLLLGIHIAIAMVAFIDFRLHPQRVLFSDYGDGLKNIYTLITYVKEPVSSQGIFKYGFFQHPFGDYLYYTDNDPLFALPFRWFCQHVYDVSAYAIIGLQLTVILNIILCGLLIFYIFRRLIENDLVAFLLAVFLPWVNLQLFRIPFGHFAFSYSSFILVPVWLVMLWHKHALDYRKRLFIALAMCLFSFIGFLAQGYYLAIITLFTASMLFFYGIYTARRASGRFTIAAAFIYAAAAVGMTLVVVGLTDKYLPLRKESANGYDWMAQKVRFTALYSHYDFQHVSFPLLGNKPRTIDPEAAAYLGNIALYAIVAFLLLSFISRTWREAVIRAQRDFFKDPLKGAIFLGSVVMLLISFGENYYTEEDHTKGLHIVNVLNPLFYIHMFTKRVEQFRSLERFAWPFFFCLYIWVGYTLAGILRAFKGRVRVAIVGVMIFFGSAELYDYINMLQKHCANNNPFNKEELASVRPHIATSQYQAILPIPYYFAGSEEYDMTLNDEDTWSRQNYQLAYVTGLPLMSCKMSRTPPMFNSMLMDMVVKDSLAPQLRQKLGSKPVLVVVNKRMIHDSALKSTPDNGSIQAKLYWAANQFADRNHLLAVDSVGDVVYYNWFPAKHVTP
jgi:hypothetical protein